jgi:hypothetical protein
VLVVIFIGLSITSRLRTKRKEKKCMKNQNKKEITLIQKGKGQKGNKIKTEDQIENNKTK